MANPEKEQIAPEGKLLINLAKAQMVIGAGLILVPGLGPLGAVAFVNGGIEYLIIQYAKRQGEKERKNKQILGG